MTKEELVEQLTTLWTRRSPAGLLSVLEKKNKLPLTAAASIVDDIDREAASLLQQFTKRKVTPQRAVICMEASTHGISSADVIRLAKAKHVSAPNGPVYLPAGTYEQLKDGYGWCRLDQEAETKWAKRVDDEYAVYDPGQWIVGSAYFNRKSNTKYRVYRIGEYLCAD